MALDVQLVRWYWCMFGFEGTIAWYTIHYDSCICLLACCSITMTMVYNIRLCAGVDIHWMCETVPCWIRTDRKCVCMSVSLNVISRYEMHYITPSLLLRTHLLFKYNGNDTRLCADVDADWIYGMVSCWLWTNRKYVFISVCLNLKVSVFGIWHTMETSKLHTRLLFKYITMAMTPGSALLLMLAE